MRPVGFANEYDRFLCYCCSLRLRKMYFSRRRASVRNLDVLDGYEIKWTDRFDATKHTRIFNLDMTNMFLNLDSRKQNV